MQRLFVGESEHAEGIELGVAVVSRAVGLALGGQLKGEEAVEASILETGRTALPVGDAVEG